MCGKMSMKVHPFYLCIEKGGRRLSSRVVRHFSPVRKRASIETLRIFYMKHGARYVGRRAVT